MCNVVILQVQMLADENKELRILLRRRYAGPESPMQNKGVRFTYTHAWHKCPQPLGVYPTAQILHLNGLRVHPRLVRHNLHIPKM
jgi:hypothetical protein